MSGGCSLAWLKGWKQDLPPTRGMRHHHPLQQEELELEQVFLLLRCVPQLRRGHLHCQARTKTRLVQLRQKLLYFQVLPHELEIELALRVSLKTIMVLWYPPWMLLLFAPNLQAAERAVCQILVRLSQDLAQRPRPPTLGNGDLREVPRPLFVPLLRFLVAEALSRLDLIGATPLLLLLRNDLLSLRRPCLYPNKSSFTR